MLAHKTMIEISGIWRPFTFHIISLLFRDASQSSSLQGCRLASEVGFCLQGQIMPSLHPPLDFHPLQIEHLALPHL